MAEKKKKKKVSTEDLIIAEGRKKGRPLTKQELIDLNKKHPQVPTGTILKQKRLQKERKKKLLELQKKKKKN